MTVEKEKEQLQQLMKQEAKLKRLQEENRKLEKEQHQIKQSRTWKFGAPIRMLNKVSRNQEHLKAFEEENKKLKNELSEVRNQEQETDGHLLDRIKRAKNNGEIIEYLDELIGKHEDDAQQYQAALTYAGRLFANEKVDFKNLVYDKVLSGLNIEDVPEFIVRDEDLPLNQLPSYRASLSMSARKRQLDDMLPEWILDHKTNAYTFMDQLQIKRPWIMEERFTFADIPKQEGIVIKPLQGAGSRGVYLVYSSVHIQDVKRSRTLTGWEALEASVQEDFASGWVSEDQWMIEELVMNDHHEKSQAMDIKFYCFYGKVALVLEIERFPAIKYCWWTAKGERISTGKYEEELFQGQGVSDRELELASAISSEIPVPFMRIDFLKTTEGLVFGEFTPKPGNYDEFDKATDAWLGDYYLEAEARLVADLLNGKAFAPFNKLYRRQHNATE